MALYKASIMGNFLGQRFVNVLWYEDVPPDPVGIDGLTAAQELGERIRSNIVQLAAFQTRMLDVTARGYTCERIEVMRYNPPPIGSANPVELLNSPQVINVNLSAPAVNDRAHSPMSVILIKLNCAGETLNPLDYTPRGGYIAVGPAQFGWVLEDGSITATQMGWLNQWAPLLAQSQDIGGGFTVRPVRVGVSRPPARPITTFGWAHVTSVSVNPRISFRRSRSGI